MANEYTSQADSMIRVTNLRNIAGSSQILKDQASSLDQLQASIAELGRRVEVELDRVFTLLRAMDSAVVSGIENTVAAGEAAAEGASKWEYDANGSLIPKDTT